MLEVLCSNEGRLFIKYLLKIISVKNGNIYTVFQHTKHFYKIKIDIKVPIYLQDVGGQVIKLLLPITSSLRDMYKKLRFILTVASAQILLGECRGGLQ